LFDSVERRTFEYFWSGAEPNSGMAPERIHVDNDYPDHDQSIIAVGGSGFGVMAILAGINRGYITRQQGLHRFEKIISFLEKADRFHGAYPHWLNDNDGHVKPFGYDDNGGDLVETSYLMQGLLCARQYFNADNPVERGLRQRISWLWGDIEWSWYTQGQEVLYWHWSPNNGWAMNFPVRGFNECMIMYVLAASSPNERYQVSSAVYHRGWAISDFFKNGKEFYGIKLPLGFDYGGPLFFSHYSFLGLDPRGLKDRYADYWEQNKNHTLINHAYCLDNPKKFKGYGENCWGLTASDDYKGYDAHSPTNDNGTISPTAALSAFPYTPEYSMKALKHFYYDLGDKIWSDYGFVDDFNETQNWYGRSHLAIDQGPIIVMIENYRSGLLWKLFMSCPEIKNGLKKLGFESPWLK
jgi:hypothetical protein